jgi:hypothetical protein
MPDWWPTRANGTEQAVRRRVVVASLPRESEAAVERFELNKIRDREVSLLRSRPR